MAQQRFANNAASTLAASITSGAGSLTVQSGDGARFPTLAGGDWFVATLQEGDTVEIVKVTARAGDTFTITRGHESTSPAAFSTDAVVELRLTAGALTGFGAIGGLQPYTAGDTWYASDTDTVAALAAGAAGTILRSTGSAPAWTTLTMPSTIAVAAILAASAANTLTAVTPSQSGSYLRSAAAAVPTWSTLALPDTISAGAVVAASGNNTVSSVTPSGTGSFLRSAAGAIPTWSTLTLPTTINAGALWSASSANAVSEIAAVATGQALLSAGTSTLPAWGKVGLTTHVSGTLPIGNGGTGLTTATTGDLLYASGTNTWAKRGIGSSGQVLSVSSGVPAWTTLSATTYQAGTVTRTSGDVSTTSTSLTDLTGASITLTTGARRVLLIFTAYQSVTGGATYYAWFNFDVDGSAQLGTSGIPTPTDDSSFCMAFLTSALSAASHTFKVRWRVSDAAATATVKGDSAQPYHFLAVELPA